MRSASSLPAIRSVAFGAVVLVASLFIGSFATASFAMTGEDFLKHGSRKNSR